MPSTEERPVDAQGYRCFSQTAGSYSLLREAWIPVLTTSGIDTRGLLAAFDDDVLVIATGDDLEDAALTRLLVAIQIAANEATLPPRDWLHAHKADFNLFDRRRPFWQNADMGRFAHTNGAVRPAMSAIYRYSGRGSTAVNPWHCESGVVVTASAAARLVVVRQQFSVGGKQPFTASAYGKGAIAGQASVATNRPFLWLDDGRLASSVKATAALVAGYPVGRFWFTWPPDTQPGMTGAPMGVLDGLTWQSRSVLLFRGDADQSPGIMICDGMRWPEDGTDTTTRDLELVPHTIFAKPDGAPTYQAQRVHPDRPAWLQLATMCADPSNPGLSSDRRSASGATFPRWRVGGLSAFQAAISGAITASFPVPEQPAALRAALADMSAARRRLSGLAAQLSEAIGGIRTHRTATGARMGLHPEFESIAGDVATGVMTPEQARPLIDAIVDALTAEAYADATRIRPMAAGRVAARRAKKDGRDAST